MTEIIMIIIGTGILGGITQSILNNDNEDYWKQKLPKGLFLGITASFLTPLFLNMISSDLLDKLKSDNFAYLEFVGLCLVLAVFSRKFIESIGDKVLKGVAQANEKADKALKETDDLQDNFYFMASKESEMEDEDSIKEVTLTGNDDFSNQVNDDLINTIKALTNPKYSFRTAKNIAKETGVGIIITESLLSTMEKFGIVKKVESKNKTALWGLTKSGEIFAKQQGYINS